MPRQAKATTQPVSDKTLVLDNGAYTMKAGLVTSASTPDPERDCAIIPNCIARARNKRTYVGAQLEGWRDFGEMSFRRPVEKGYLVNWEAEREIWEKSFFDKDAKVKCDPAETNLLLTEAPNAPQTLQANCDQMVFEEFGFAAYYRCIGPCLNAYNDVQALYGMPPRPPDAALVPSETLFLVDSGYSHTTVTPVIRGRPAQTGIRRLDIGGKLLTNYLKELASIRHYNMMDETYVMNEAKETVCFVASDFKRDLARTWKGASKDMGKVGGRHTSDMMDDGVDEGNDDDIRVDYVLPDFNNQQHGVVRAHDPAAHALRARKLALGGGSGVGASGGAGAAGRAGNDVPEEIMTLGNERFTVPELLFHPTDIGMSQAGLPETIMQSLQTLPGGLWPALLANVVLTGGNAKIPGFVERLESELRQLAPSECVLRVTKPPDPVKYTWLGGAHLASDKAKLQQVMVTRQQYQECGSQWLARRFAGHNK